MSSMMRSVGEKKSCFHLIYFKTIFKKESFHIQNSSFFFLPYFIISAALFASGKLIPPNITPYF